MVEGAQPVRIDVFGGGLALSQGVETRAIAFDGALAAAVTAASARGVAVSNWSGSRLSLLDQLISSGLTPGGQLTGFAVWCPDPRRMLRASQRRKLFEVVEDLAELRDMLVVVELPVPVGSARVISLARPMAHHLNHLLREAFGGRSRTFVVAPPRVAVGSGGAPIFDTDFYRVTGERIAAAVSFI